MGGAGVGGGWQQGTHGKKTGSRSQGRQAPGRDIRWAGTGTRWVEARVGRAGVMLWEAGSKGRRGNTGEGQENGRKGGRGVGTSTGQKGIGSREVGIRGRQGRHWWGK